MCNQSKLMARRQVRVMPWPGSLKAREMQPVPAFCHSAKLSVWVLFTVVCQLHKHSSSIMSKATSKTKNKGESRSCYRLCVPPCPRYITSGDTHNLCVVWLLDSAQLLDSVRFINNYPISFGQKSWCNLWWSADLQRAHCKDCSILQVCTSQHQKDQALSNRACSTTSCPGPCHF